MNDVLNLKETMEWYVLAGVVETCGDSVFRIEEISKNKKVEAVPAMRQATTHLADDSLAAVKNAREICEGANSLKELRQGIEKFDGCALKLTAANTVFGDGFEKARIMFIGEAPGADEDRIGKPFVGRSGQLLDKMIKAVGLDRTNSYISNILPWRPPGNRTPTAGEIAVCLPFIKRQIDIIKPEVIVMLGGSAANALLETAEPISKLRGKWLEYRSASGHTVQVMATFHPAYLLRNAGQKAKVWSDLLRLDKKSV